MRQIRIQIIDSDASPVTVGTEADLMNSPEMPKAYSITKRIEEMNRPTLQAYLRYLAEDLIQKLLDDKFKDK